MLFEMVPIISLSCKKSPVNSSTFFGDASSLESVLQQVASSLESVLQQVERCQSRKSTNFHPRNGTIQWHGLLFCKLDGRHLITCFVASDGGPFTFVQVDVLRKKESGTIRRDTVEDCDYHISLDHLLARIGPSIVFRLHLLVYLVLRARTVQ
jgi:hypothetical protein